MKISSFAQFLKEHQEIHSIMSPLNEAYKYKNLRLNSITYKDLYNNIHDRMWRVAKDIIYEKGYQGDPLNNNIVIKWGDSEMKASELFYILWANIDQYTSDSSVGRHDLEGRMEYLSDGATRDYKNSEWYPKMIEEQGINAGYFASGYLGDFVEKVVNLMNKYYDSEFTLRKEAKQYNLENPKNVRKLAREGKLRNALKMENEILTTYDFLKFINNKEECINAYIKQTSEGVIKNPAFGLEDYSEALASCKGFMQMKMNRPDTTTSTIGWNLLYYINEFIYEFVLYYFSIAFSESIKGYRE